MTSAATTMIDTSDRVQKLRQVMQSPPYGVNAFVIPSEDAHQSEYVAECDEQRAYISGFTGSAGLAIVSTDSAALFTDGRYFLQASQQLDANWALMKSGLPGIPTWQEYLVKNLPAGSRIGIDPLLLTATDARKLETELAQVESSLVSVPNLVDMIWKDRPSRPARPLMILSTSTTGKTHTEKIQQLRRTLEEKGVAGCVVSGLDEIAWLFNMRGSDVHCNPVFFAYAIITQDDVQLYLQDKAISTKVKKHLGSEVLIRPYETIYEDLRALSKKLKDNKHKILLGTRTNLALSVALGKENTLEVRSPVTDAKAIKNDVELEGMRQCHLRDAAAVINYFAWLEEQLGKGIELDEADGAERLQQFRVEQKGFVGPSFDTISSTGPNGAIIHYKPEKPTAATIDPDQVYLCDSGAQYLDGTTDITRTLHFKTPTEYERRCFTRVLQGHIAIDSAVFPDGTTGYLLDILSRRALWSDGLDFRHGTGHGVGAFLNVHEGPHGCGARPAFNEVPLTPGMTLTNEPGYYEDGRFGIRIENVLVVRKAQTRHRFGGKEYYGFDHITFVPIQTKMIDRTLLSREEVEWVNRYHTECLERVSPFLKKDSLGLRWLQREAAPL
ncbi:Creatinase/aminopeptidase [Gamsiella multidivaricata]|uniref:Creatinase/aminopeptidase n=1 Tax=Gamsiella multidivaricata TaxID=101098 RepID=UPI00221F7DB8|nr:Creatinase/aminopeptidase [Gamsiella multidivaricata]KAI7824315.1 Creatinase/aminopeptidase [Gamsiella multidivaricata]